MDQGTAQAVKDIESTRERLGSNIEALEQRLPPPAKLARRAAGIAVGSGMSGTLFWFAVKKMRKRKAEKAQDARIILNVIPEDMIKRIATRMEEGRWQAWLGGAAGAWLLLRLAELRQLRGVKRSLAAR